MDGSSDKNTGEATRERNALLLSVVIITKNEEKHIRRCIESLTGSLTESLTQGLTESFTEGLTESLAEGLAENPSSVEIILVDSASTDNTIERAMKYPIKIIRIDDSSFLSPAAGLYIGYKHARGKYLFFVNGDMTVEPAWFPEALLSIRSDNRIAGVGGRVTEYRGGTGPGTGKDSARNSDTKSLIIRQEAEGTVPYLGGAALYRKSVLDEVGPFNPFLYGEEEAELGYRLSASGYRVVRLPMTVAHHWGTYETGKQTIKRSTGYIRGYGQTLRKNLRTGLFRQHAGRIRRAVFSAIWSVLTIILIPICLLLYLFHSRPPYFDILIALAIGETTILLYSIYEKRSVGKGIMSAAGWFLKGLAVARGFLTGLKDPDEYSMKVKVLKDG